MWTNPKIIRHPEEDSIYRGEPILKPRYSYEVFPEYRKLESGMPFYQKVPAKIKCIVLDFKDYAADLVLNRQEMFSFKTAFFVKRNYHKFAHVAHHGWDELKKVGRGFRMLNEDLKFFLRF